MFISNEKAGSYGEFLKKGYMPSGDITKQPGYVSRKIPSNAEMLDLPVYIAGRGKRQGEFFVLMPNFHSTRFCYRVYLRRVI